VSGRAGRRRFHSFLEANRIDKGQRHRKEDSLHANARGYSSSATVCKAPLCQYELCQVAIFFSDPSCHVLLLGHCVCSVQWNNIYGRAGRALPIISSLYVFAPFVYIIDIVYGFF
jgi:hypothetical protein